MRIQRGSSRRRVGFRAFSNDLGEDVLVERQIGHQALQAGVLVTQLAQLLHLRHAHVAVTLLPDVETRLAASQPPADLRRRCPGFDLAQGVGDLLVGKSLLLHRRVSSSEDPDSELSPIPNCPTKLGPPQVSTGVFQTRPPLEAALMLVPGIAFGPLAGFCCYACRQRVTGNA